MFVVIEGADGSGKGTQVKLLADRLNRLGRKVTVFQFPRYGQSFFAGEIANYLNGEFGALMEVPAKLGSMMYAGDRWESRKELLAGLANGNVVICDRYVGSNQAHHAAKLPRQEWPDFFDWVEALEYKTYRIPRPDVEIFLEVDATMARRLISLKPGREYTSLQADIHQANTEYQERVLDAYRLLAGRPDWQVISCMDGSDSLRSENDIADEVFASLSKRFDW